MLFLENLGDILDIFMFKGLNMNFFSLRKLERNLTTKALFK